MTDRTLSYVLRSLDISKGTIVREVDNLTAVLFNDHRTVVVRPNGRYVDRYDYLVLLCDGKKAGIILKCGSVDIHTYVYQRYRKQHIVSRLTRDGFLKKLWPDIDSVTCVNSDEYERIKHLAEIAGFWLRD